MPTTLNHEQLRQAAQLMYEYLSSPSIVEGKSLAEYEADLDSKRVDVIESDLKPSINRYLNNEISLADFKTTIDSINKRNELWGFRGIKGQMFFNMIVNVADDLDECDAQIKAAINLPQSES